MAATIFFAFYSLSLSLCAAFSTSHVTLENCSCCRLIITSIYFYQMTFEYNLHFSQDIRHLTQRVISLSSFLSKVSYFPQNWISISTFAPSLLVLAIFQC